MSPTPFAPPPAGNPYAPPAFRVGEVEVHRVMEIYGGFRLPTECFPHQADDVLGFLAEHGDLYRGWALDPRDNDRLLLGIQTYVLKLGGLTVLVDTCVGCGKTFPATPHWHQRTDERWLRRLEAIGVPAESVDYVLCTHLHGDHVGWNTRLRDGEWVPTFPNAKYIFARKEHDFWEQRHRDGSEGPVPNVYEDSVLPVMQAGQAVLVEMDHEIDEGVWFEPAPGHTAGNVVLNLRSQGRTAVLSGDVMHHPVQLIRPDWSSRACEDPVQSAATRRALLERIADTDTLIAPAHFPAPSIGHVRSRGEAFDYRFLGED